MTSPEKIESIQRILEVNPDRRFGPISFAALNGTIALAERAGIIHNGLASSFADEQDIKGYRECKAEGKPDQVCFRRGDNGKGFWGDDTTVDVPMCALPPEDWQPLGPAARGAKVAVTIGGRTVICELRDTMPHKANIRNGAIIDLAPGAQEAFGIKPPFLVPCSWRWE